MKFGTSSVAPLSHDLPERERRVLSAANLAAGALLPRQKSPSQTSQGKTEIRMKPMAVVLALAFASGSAVALAAERTIGQKGKVFSESSLTIKKGDVVVFMNDDNVSHNVMTVGSGADFNTGSQAPGDSTPIVFEKAGEFTILCAMHPRMKMVVKVTN
jgi:plastocyanin